MAHKSKFSCRKPTLFNIKELEQLGSGILRILEHYWKESFSFSKNLLGIAVIVKEGPVEKGGQVSGQIGGQIDKAADGAIDKMNMLTKRQKQILKLVYMDNTISRAGISEVIHINESAIQKHLNALKEKGFLKRIGGTRGYWQTDFERD
ncbi:LexA family protein [Pricia sp.]|uniref:LexA family protein n=1 Tax=Pricia sp. TaxID=2268138 RepID=UPI0035948CC4